MFLGQSEAPAKNTEAKLQLEPALGEELSELEKKPKDELAKEVLRLIQQNEQLLITIDILGRMRPPLDYNKALDNQVAVLTRAVDALMEQVNKAEKRQKGKEEKEEVEEKEMT